MSLPKTLVRHLLTCYAPADCVEWHVIKTSQTVALMPDRSRASLTPIIPIGSCPSRGLFLLVGLCDGHAHCFVMKMCSKIIWDTHYAQWGLHNNFGTLQIFWDTKTHLYPFFYQSQNFARIRKCSFKYVPLYLMGALLDLSIRSCNTVSRTCKTCSLIYYF